MCFETFELVCVCVCVCVIYATITPANQKHSSKSKAAAATAVQHCKKLYSSYIIKPVGIEHRLASCKTKHTETLNTLKLYATDCEIK